MYLKKAQEDEKLLKQLQKSIPHYNETIVKPEETADRQADLVGGAGAPAPPKTDRPADLRV